MSEATYRHGTKYSKALIVTDMFSKYMFARSLISGDENDYERLICRLLIDIFSSFGLPGYFLQLFFKIIFRGIFFCLWERGY